VKLIKEYYDFNRCRCSAKLLKSAPQIDSKVKVLFNEYKMVEPIKKDSMKSEDSKESINSELKEVRQRLQYMNFTFGYIIFIELK
jgi:hypothetical protein